MALPPAAKMQVYIDTARRRQQQQHDQLRKRREQGLAVAQNAAQVLREEFGVRQVVLFGSVLGEASFHENSDLDLAVWGLSPTDYIKAVARLTALSGFSIDLVEAETASPHLQASIEQGITL